MKIISTTEIALRKQLLNNDVVDIFFFLQLWKGGRSLL